MAEAKKKLTGTAVRKTRFDRIFDAIPAVIGKRGTPDAGISSRIRRLTGVSLEALRLSSARKT